MAGRMFENRAIIETGMELDTLTITQRREALEKELYKIVATLVEKYEPEKIIFFGSLATGGIHEWSDIDLLIVKETSTRRFYRRAEALKGIERNIPLDLIILTPEEVRFLCGERAFFIKDVLEQGHVVYEKEKSLSKIRPTERRFKN
jgi:predicted nucleotidyltransferase